MQPEDWALVAAGWLALVAIFAGALQTKYRVRQFGTQAEREAAFLAQHIPPGDSW